MSLSNTSQRIKVVLDNTVRNLEVLGNMPATCVSKSHLQGLQNPYNWCLDLPILHIGGKSHAMQAKST